MNYLKVSEFFNDCFYWIWPLLTHIGEFCIAHESTLVTFLIGIVTLYLACYAIAWAKYEFYITRQSQQVSVFAALCATDDAKRISFAPSLSHMTQKKLPKYPTLMTPYTIILGLFRVQDNEKQLMEYNLDTIDTVSKIIKGFEHWEGANFSSIILNKANLERVYFMKAILIESNFNEAIFMGANLWKVNLTKSNLYRANLTGANLYEANLVEANMIEANMTGARLKKAYFTGANLKGAYFCGAELTDAYFTRSNLEKANLTSADLIRANLREANLKEAVLIRIRCCEANFAEANLTGANFAIMINTNNNTLYEIDNNTTDPQLIQKCVDLLSPAKTLFEATLPKPVEKVLREKYPHLFEPPA